MSLGSSYAIRAALGAARMAIGRNIAITISLTATAASAQMPSDGLVCANANLTQDQVRSHLAAMSWTVGQDAQDDIRLSAIFLGNLDGQDPTSWAETYNWAVGLAEDGTDDGTVYSWHNSSALLGKNTEGHNFCIVVTNEMLLDDLRRKFPKAKLIIDGPRRFLKHDDGTLRFVASEMANWRLPAELPLTNNTSFTATFVNRGP